MASRPVFTPVENVLNKVLTSKDLELYVVATGMHLMPEFGYTLKEIEKDGFQVYKKVDSAGFYCYNTL